MKAFLRRAALVRRMAGLGANPFAKLVVAKLYLYYYASQLLGLPVIPWTLHLRVNGKACHMQVRAWSDFWVIKDILLDQEYAVALAPPVRTVIDLGGNIGITAIFFATCYPEAQIHVVEPNPSAFAQLVQNTKPFGNVHAYQLAIADAAATMTLYVGKHNAGASFSPRTPQDVRIDVPTESLDGFLRRIGVSEIDLLKFDMEGAERYLFRDFAGFETVRCYVGEVHYDLSDLKPEELRARARGYRYHEAFPHRPERSILLLEKIT